MNPTILIAWAVPAAVAVVAVLAADSARRWRDIARGRERELARLRKELHRARTTVGDPIPTGTAFLDRYYTPTLMDGADR